MNGRAGQNSRGCAPRSSSRAGRFHGPPNAYRQSCENRGIVAQETRIATSPEMNPVPAECVGRLGDPDGRTTLRPPKGERDGLRTGRKEHPKRARPRSRHKARDWEANMMREEK